MSKKEKEKKKEEIMKKERKYKNVLKYFRVQFRIWLSAKCLIFETNYDRQLKVDILQHETRVIVKQEKRHYINKRMVQWKVWKPTKRLQAKKKTSLSIVI